jgi:hypothetical protein
MNKNKRLIEEKQDVFDFTSISGIWYQAPSIKFQRLLRRFTSVFISFRLAGGRGKQRFS